MAIDFKCKCGHEYRVADEMAGKPVVCTDCSRQLTVPHKRRKKSHSTALKLQPDSLVITDMNPVQKCPRCGATADLDAVVCVECGYNIDEHSALETKFRRAEDYYADLKIQHFIVAAWSNSIQELVNLSLKAFVGYYLLLVFAGTMAYYFATHGIAAVFGETVGRISALLMVSALCIYCLGGVFRYLFAYCEENCHRGGHASMNAWGNWQCGLFGALLIAISCLPLAVVSIISPNPLVMMCAVPFFLMLFGPLLFLSLSERCVDWQGLHPLRLLRWMGVMLWPYLGVFLLLCLDFIVLSVASYLLLDLVYKLSSYAGVIGGIGYILVAVACGFGVLLHVSCYMATLMSMLYRVHDYRLCRPVKSGTMLLPVLVLPIMLVFSILIMRTTVGSRTFDIDDIQIPGFQAGLREMSPAMLTARKEYLDAAAKGDIATMERLIKEEDVPLNASTYESNRTALHLGIKARQPNVVVFMLSLNADIHAKDLEGNTPLHMAAEYGAHEQILQLLAAGAQIDEQNLAGRTPLHQAAWFGQAEAAKVLLAKGANRVAKDYDGRTPAALADVRGFSDLRAFLVGE